MIAHLNGELARIEADWVVIDVNGIGYGGPANHQGTKALKIRKTADSPSVEPTQDNVVNGKYPIRRYLYSYLSPAKDSGEIAAYLNWIRSSTGKRIATDAGFYALPVNLQEKEPWISAGPPCPQSAGRGVPRARCDRNMGSSQSAQNMSCPGWACAALVVPKQCGWTEHQWGSGRGGFKDLSRSGQVYRLAALWGW